MSTIKGCLATAVAMKVITAEEAKKLGERYDAIAKETLDTAEARARLQKEIEAEAEHRERAAILTDIARTRILAELDGYRNAKGEKDKLRAWLNTHENMGHDGTFIQDAENRRLVIANEAQSELRQVLQQLHRGMIVGDLRRTSKLVGNKKTQILMANMVKELFGEKSGDPMAEAMAKAWEKVSEDLRVRFNAAGGNVGKLERWGLPQGHDALALLGVGREKWVARMMQPGVLDRERMVHPLTRQRLSDADLRAALDDIYSKVTTDGWSDKDITAQPKGKGALYTQHMDHRFLHFANADAWMAYAKEFGTPDPYAAMMGHIAVMARDIAHIETFGPNANAMRQWISNSIKKEMITANPGDRDRINKGLKRADAMWTLQRGMEPGSVALAERMQSIRNFISATSLPKAWLSSLNDPAFGQDTRMRIGMGFATANFARVMTLGLKELITRGSREEAIDAMLGLDSAQQVLRQKAQEVKGWDHRFWTGYMADRTLTWGLLSPWTQGGKHIVGLDIMTFVGKHVGKSFDELGPGTRKTFLTHGIDAAVWDKIRAVPLHEGKRLRPNEILSSDGGRALGERYLQMILRETRHAVPEATVRSRSIVASAAPPGTLVGDMARSAGQFKGFGIAVIFLHAGRLAREIQAGEYRGAAGFGLSLMVTSVLLGAVSMALKDVDAGRDPRKWLDEKTWLDWRHWGAALLQSGGLGIYGDLIFSDVNRFGGGLESTIAGPLVGRVSDIGDATLGQVAKLATGKKTNAAAASTKLLRQNAPFVNHWATSLLYQHMLVDQLQKWADPEAAAAFQRDSNKRWKDYGQRYWYEPGAQWPRRAPDLSRVLSTR